MDTVLASALSDGTPLPSAKGVASMPLPPVLVMRVIVRLAAVMYAQIPHLNLEQRTVRLQPLSCWIAERADLSARAFLAV